MSHRHRRAKSVASSAVSSSIKTNYGFDDEEVPQQVSQNPASPTPYLSAKTLASNTVSGGVVEPIARTAPVLQMPRDLSAMAQSPPDPLPPSLIPPTARDPDPEVSFDGESVAPSTVLRFPGKNKKAVALKGRREVSESSSSSLTSSVSLVDEDDEVDLIIEETKDQKKERVKKEKAEVEKLLKKQKKRINKCVSCIIVPLGGLVLLKRVFESLF